MVPSSVVKTALSSLILALCCFQIAQAQEQTPTFVKSFDFGSLSAASICSFDQAQFAETLTVRGEPLIENSRLYQQLKSSDVFIAGETHLYTDLGARTDMIKMFREIKGSRACVAFEIPKGPRGVTGFLSQRKEQASREHLDKENAWRAGIIDDLVTYYESMSVFATSLGLQVKAVDHPENFEKDLSMGLRNHAMADEIAGLLKNHRCDAVLLFVGKAHETQSDPSTPAISTLLKDRSFNVTSVNLQMTYEYSLNPQIRTWHACAAPQIPESLVLDRSQISSKFLIAPVSGEQVRFADFDFTLFIPFEARNYPCSSCLK